jgi:hypothetical protein
MQKQWVITAVINFEKAYDSAILYSILIEFGIPMKLLRLIKMKPIVKSAELRICLMHFLLRMV